MSQASRIEDASRRVPERLDVAWAEDDGQVALRRRKFGPAGTALLRLFRVAPDLTIRLDPLGSATWRLVDGRRTVDEILHRLRQQFPGEENLAQRLGQYLSQLASHGFLRLR